MLKSNKNLIKHQIELQNNFFFSFIRPRSFFLFPKKIPFSEQQKKKKEKKYRKFVWCGGEHRV
jgi:hypothetical protein